MVTAEQNLADAGLMDGSTTGGFFLFEISGISTIYVRKLRAYNVGRG